MPSRALPTSLFAALCIAGSEPAAAQPQPRAPRLQAAQLAIVVNDADPESVALGQYYRRARGVPESNVVHVSISGKPRSLDPAAFAALKAGIDRQLGPAIEAVLMVWTTPYAVGCNSITSAYSLGYDAAQCQSSCAAGKASAYYDSTSARPFTDHKIRISMLLPLTPGARALVERGVASGFRVAPASAYYLHTSEAARNARTPLFPRQGRIPALKLQTRILRSDALQDAGDIMIYQTGSARVDKLDTLGFLPGALADHLTSYGGDLLGTYQMSSLRWLEAGATASYGTVSEPCNHWQKFPHPSVLLKHYIGGSTAIEAYWRSVAWPAQGLFIGEPLAAPYGR